ncbi:MAG: hypothetical protein HZB62_06175 [Nitrospirae bacterium]|nr:hypothetical protein [Nitrospirota bacterium]
MNHFVLHKAIMALVVAAVLCCGAAAFGQDDWKAEFDDICAKTDQAMTLPKEELVSLVERCDKLKLRIEQLEETQKKVYLRRLQLCRNLFAFTIDTLKNK